jgi:hypothetical protein
MEEEQSITWVVFAATVFVAAFGWGFLASSYPGTPVTSMHSNHDDLNLTGDAVSIFVLNAISQLPNLPTIISWHFSNRIWLLILIGMAFVGVLGGGFALKRLEKILAQPKQKRK